MVKVVGWQFDWIGVIAGLFGAAVVIPSLVALIVNLGAVAASLF